MGGIFNTVDLSGHKDIILPTVLRVGKEELDYWTNMTCVYDKQWEFNPKLSTVPISFFHITSVTEITTSQGSEKRVIVYEAPSQSSSAIGFDPKVSSHPAYKNNLEVIIDNVVVQPKQYQMEVIVPDSLIGPFQQQGVSRLTALLDYMSLTLDAGGDVASKISDGVRTAQVFLDTVQTVADLADTILGASLGSTQMATMNKNSLDAMVGSGHVVVFKKWTGYDYSYGLLTKVDIAKKPTENGVYRGSITFQEVPILNISQKQIAASTSNWKDTIQYGAAQTARIMNIALALPFIKMTGVMDEAGAPGSDSADGGSFTDIFK